MPTVPGKPDDDLSFLHPAFRPTPADFLQAASIVNRHVGRQVMPQSLMKTLGSKADWGKFEREARPSTNIEDVRREPLKDPYDELELEKLPEPKKRVDQ